MVFYVYQLGLPYFTNNYHVDHVKPNKLGGIFSHMGRRKMYSRFLLGKKKPIFPLAA